jgi:ABC-2 type transport system ATP-binding protein
VIAVETVDLRRTYKSRDKNPDVVALDGISLAIEEGEVRGLLGPNGAGKTTLVKVLSTVLLPTAGSASVMGHDVEHETAAVRPLIGIVLGGDRGLYWRLTGRQNLEYWAALYKVPPQITRDRVTGLLDRVGLGERGDYLVETYSRGMKQRLHLARSLVADARVLFLDEPTTGMDPIAARQFRELVGQLRAEGRTILLTTHDMVEAETVCDKVTLIDHGRIVAEETPRTLARLMAQNERIDFEGEDILADKLRGIPGIASVKSTSDGSYRVEVADASATREALSFLVESGVTSIRTSRPSLEEVYVHIMGDRGIKV